MRNLTLWIRQNSTLVIFYLLGTSLLSMNYGNYWHVHWYGKFTVLMAIASCIFSGFLCRQKGIGWIHFPILAYTLCSGVYVGMFAFNHFTPENGYDVIFREGLARDSLYAFICVVFAALWIAFFPRRWVRETELLLAGICTASIIYTWFQLPMTAYERGAFSGNASMNGCLIAVLYPFLARLLKSTGLKFILMILTFSVILMTGASIPIGVFLVVILTQFMVVCDEFELIKIPAWLFITAAVLISGLVLGVGWLIQGKELFNSTGRFEQWPIIAAWWHLHDFEIFGSGLGTTAHIVSAIQIHNILPGKMGSIMLWVHNEWLQIYLELGLVGLTLASISWGDIVMRAYTRPHLLASWVGFGAMAFFNYPLRLPIHLGCLVLLTGLILRGSKPSGNSLSASSEPAP